ncbi:MAG: CARDB domain-containing protein [Gemmataceae bacterium]
MQYLSGTGNNNLRFQSIYLQPDTLTTGQSVALNAIGTQTTNNLRYVFPGSFTINSGATLAVGANVPVTVGPSPSNGGTMTLAVNGTLSFASGDTVTLNAVTAYNTTTQITVGSGGLLTANGTTFNASVANGGFTQIVVASGGHLQASGSTFAVGQLNFNVGALVNAGDLSGNAFDSPLYIPAINVQYLSGTGNNNLRFQSIYLQPDTLTTGQSVALNAIGTQTTNNLRYVFPGNFTINSGATLAVGANVPVTVGPSPSNGGTMTLAVNGTLSFASGDIVTLNAVTAYNTTTQITVGSGGLLSANGTTFNATVANSGTTQIVVATGAQLIANNGAIGIGTLSLANGSYVTVQSNTVTSNILINSGAQYASPSGFTISGNNFANIPANGVTASGSKGTFIYLQNNTWSATPANQIVDSVDNANLPTIVFSPPAAGPATTTTASNASVSYSDANANVTLNATVTTGSGTVNEGVVTFVVLDGGTQIGNPASAAVVNGVASTSTPYVLPAGTPISAYTIQAVYSDNGATKYAGSSDTAHQLTVAKTTTTTKASNVSTTFNTSASSVTLTAQVTGPGVVGSGTVTFTIPTLSSGTATANVVNGVATANFSVPAGAAFGTYPIVATYSGNTNFFSSLDNGSRSLSIVSGTTTTNTGNVSVSYATASQPLNLTATVSAAITVNEGTVAFTITNAAHAVIATQTVNVNKGTAATTNLSLPAALPSVFTIAAAYSDSTGNFSGSNYASTLTIGSVNTTTAAQNQSAPFSAVQQTVSVNATVTSSAGTINEGTVTFTILNGATVIAGPSSAIAVSGGSAATNLDLPGNTAQGNYTIRAVYANAAGNLNGSSDNSHVLTVAAPPAATVSLSLLPASDSGAPLHSGRTNDTTPTFRVQVNQPGIITINFDGTHTQSQTVGAAGTYQFTSPVLADGSYVANAKFNAGLGGSPQSNLSFVIDTTPPTATASAPNAVVNTGVSQIQVTFSELVDLPASAITLTGPSGAISVNAPQFVSGTTYRFTFPTQSAQGTYQLQIGSGAKDYAGNALGQTYTSSFTVALPTLSVVSASVPSAGVEGAAIPVSWKVANTSATNPTASTWNDAIYLSTQTTLDGSAILLKTVASPTAPLAAGTNYSRSTLVTLPSDVAPGSYYVLVVADADGGQPVASTTGLVLANPIALTAADLKVTGVSGPITGVVGQTAQVSWTVLNSGAANASAPWVDRVYLVSDTSGSNPVLAGSFTYGGGLASGNSVSLTQEITLPNVSGTLYFMVTTNATRSVGEGTAYGDNTTVAAAAIVVAPAPLPNLVVTSITPPQNGVLSGTTVPITFLVSNQGDAPTSVPHWQDWVILSRDPNLADTYQGQLNPTGPGGDQILNSQPIVRGVANVSYLNPGDSYTQTVEVGLPIDASGTWYVYVVPNGTGAHHPFSMAESSRTDNLAVSAPFSITLAPPPALTVSAVTVPSQNNSGKPMAVSWTVTNTGTGPTAASSWTEAVYLSATPTLDSNATLLGTFIRQGALAKDAAYTRNVSVNLPVGISGDYYVIVRTDVKGQVFQNGNTAGGVAATSTTMTVHLTPPPDLTVSGIAWPATVTAGHSFTFSYAVVNNGAGETPNTTWTDSLYLSPTPTYNAATAISLGQQVHQGPLGSHGDSYVNTVTATFPTGLAGTFYLIVNTDSGNAVFELPSAQANKWGSSPNPVTASLAPANLVVSSVSAASSAIPGAGVEVTWTVTNQGGNDTGVAVWYDTVYASTSSTFDGSAVPLGSFVHYGLLAGHASYTQSQLVTIPIRFLGNYKLFVVADSGQAVFEGTRNTTSAPFPIAITLNAGGQQAPVADLHATSVVASPVVNGSVTVDWVVENIGTGLTNATVWNDEVWASTHSTLNSGGIDVLLGVVPHVNVLAAGASYSASATFSIPQSMLAGNYYFIVKTNRTDAPTGDTDGGDDNQAYESDTTNNQTSTSSTQPSSPATLPNLTVTNVTAPAIARSGQPMQVTWTVANSGAETAGVPVIDSVYLSLGPTFDPATARYLGSVTYSGNVISGGGYTQTATLTIPAGVAGTFHVFVVANSSNNLPTSSRAGATAAAPGTLQIQIIPPADLVAGAVVAPANASAGQNVSISYQVTNGGGNPVNGVWTDAVYLSTSTTWSPSDRLLGTVTQARNLLPGQSYTGTLTAAVPGLPPGPYHVIVRSNIQNSFPEEDLTNNAGVSTGTIAIDAPSLTLGTSTNGTLVQDRSAYYKVVVPAGQTLRFTIDTASNAFNELYVSYGTMPERSRYQYRYGVPFSGDQTVTVPTTQAGTYYVLAYAGTVPTTTESYSIKAELIPFSVQSVSPAQVGSGPVTIAITGARFTSDVAFQLQNAGETVSASRVFVKDSATVYATFDLTGRSAGSWSLTATEPSQSPVTLNAAVTVVSATTNNTVRLNMIVPDAVLVGRPGAITITYGNPGNTDLPAPVIFVTGGNVFFQVPGQAGYTSGTVQVFGANPDGPFGTLPPGFQGTITIPFVPLTAGAGLSSNFSLQTLSDPSEPFPWTAFATNDVPVNTSPQQWAAMVNQARGVMGSTWGSVVNFLGTNGIRLLLNRADRTDPTTAAGPYNFVALLQYAVGVYGSATASPATPNLPVVASEGQVTIYNGNLDGSGNPRTLNPSYPTFVLVPGYGGYRSEFADLARAIAADAALYPNGHVNILIATWSGAAAGSPWASALDVFNAGRDLGSLLTQINQQGGITFDTTAVIAQGSGADVANTAAEFVGGLSAVIALNPAAAAGGFVSLDLTKYFGWSVAYGTSSFFGLQSAIAAFNRTLPTGDLNDPVAMQAFGIKWLVEQILSGRDSVLDPRLEPEPDSIPVGNDPAPLPMPSSRVVVSARVLQIESIDPNSIIGPKGSGANGAVPQTTPMPYTVTFENTSPTQAPAQRVVIKQNVDPAGLNWQSFRLTAFGFAGHTYQIPNAPANYQTTLIFNGYKVEFFANLDQLTGVATWIFTTIDLATGQVPLNPLVGFLPSNDANGLGEGFVSYTIVPKSTAPTGTVITAQASIIFDTQPPLNTNVAINTVDAGTGLTSTVQTLSGVQTTERFNVTWGGEGATAGSGVNTYDVYVSDNGGPYSLWLVGTSLTTAEYSGQNGHTYAFYSVATDNVGNRQIIPATAQSTTTVSTGLPTSTVTSLPSYSGGSFTVAWSGSGGTGPAVAYYDIYVSIDGGAFTLWQAATSGTSATYTGANGRTYAFYSVATDTLGSRQPTPAGAQATTIVDTGAPTSSVAVLPAFSLGNFAVSWSGTDSGSGIATYDVYVSDNGGAFTRWLSATTQTTATFTGSNGHTYGFYSVASDIVGNVQSAPGGAQAATAVDTVAPSSTVAAQPAFSLGNFAVSWSGTDSGSGIASYDVYVSDNGGAFTRWLTATTLTTSTYTGSNGHTYGFYAVAKDKVGNIQPTPGAAQATTTVDTAVPSSTVAALPSFSPGGVSVNWSGADGGSGLATFDVYVSDNGAPFTRWLAATTLTTSTYTGLNGHSYGFYTVATDKLGNVQPTPAGAQASTTVDTTAPSSSVAALPSFSPAIFGVNWSGSDSGSGLASYDVYVSDNGGAFARWLSGTSQTTATYTGVSGHTCGFYSVARDAVGNVQAAPGGAQATTLVDASAPSSTVAALPSFSLASFAVSWSGSDGGSGLASYDVYVSDNGGAFTRWQTAHDRDGGELHGFERPHVRLLLRGSGRGRECPVHAGGGSGFDHGGHCGAVEQRDGPAVVQSANFAVSWSGAVAVRGFGLTTCTSRTTAGRSRGWLSATTQTSATYAGQTGHSYGFYTVATDKLGNVQSAPAGSQASTTVDTTALLEQRDGPAVVQLGELRCELVGQRQQFGRRLVRHLRLGQRRGVHPLVDGHHSDVGDVHGGERPRLRVLLRGEGRGRERPARGERRQPRPRWTRPHRRARSRPCRRSAWRASP